MVLSGANNDIGFFNNLKHSNIITISGNNNLVDRSDHTIIYGSHNLVNNTSNSIVLGQNINVTQMNDTILIGNNFQRNISEASIIFATGNFDVVITKYGNFIIDDIDILQKFHSLNERIKFLQQKLQNVQCKD